MKNIAIIPARSGSKGLQDKNIKCLCGKPLMAYSIEAALESDCFDVVMVSTDSDRYAEIARRIDDAAARVGRDPRDITLVAVTKTHTADEINEAIDAGATDIGENRVQEMHHSSSTQ